MLELKNIVKTYPMAEEEVVALNGVSVAFRNSEFVAILGQSGCGKTTLLNIIGGLDRYTSGDLLVNGRSTTSYTDADWDAYRNHSVGFVFQSYNLISHQSVLANVEMALELSGVPKAEQRRRAVEALERVGLGDQLEKRPAMMSGGQMQRVAIARALVNNPDIILADEPTGALDSKTSVQIMDLLQEIAQDRLVVMVTHNPELAERYATRIVRLSDGEIASDTNPLSAAEVASIEPQPKPRHTRLPFLAALGLSANNLRTKKGRAFLTAFAGAIGIIGIALILSLSSGMNDYIHKLETDVMGNYPIEIDSQTMNMGPSLEASIERQQAMTQEETDEDAEPAPLDHITSENLVGDTYRSLNTMIVNNNLAAFRTYIESHRADIDPYVTAISYSYNVNPVAWREGANGEPVLVSPRSLIESDGGYASMSLSMTSGISTDWKQLVDNQHIREDRFELAAGAWPSEANEVALVVDQNGYLSDFYLYTLGLMDLNRMQDIIDAAQNDEDIDDPVEQFTFEDAIGRTYEVFSPSELYVKKGDVYVNKQDDTAYMQSALDEGRGVEVTIVGVLQATDRASYTQGVVYTGKLTQELMARAAETDVVKAQLANPDVDVLTGEEFGANGQVTGEVDAFVASNMSGMFRMSGTSGEATMRQAGLAALTFEPLGHAEMRGGTAAVAQADEKNTDTGTEETDITADSDTETDPGAGTDTGAGTGSGNNTDPSAGTDPDTDPGTSTDPAPTGPSDTATEAQPYAVTFVNWNGDNLTGPKYYAEGARIESAPVDQPTRASDGSLLYLFMGWSDGGTIYQSAQALPPVTGDVTYTATFLAVPPSSTTAQIGAIIQALQQLTPEQMALLTRAMQGGQVTVEDLINAGVITPEQLQEMQGQAQEQVEQLAQQYIQNYLDSIDQEALIKQYLSQMDQDALMQQLMGSMDPEAMIQQYLDSMSPEELASLFGAGVNMGDFEELMAAMSQGPSTYESVLQQLGYATIDDPYAITFYPIDFDSKQKVQDFIAAYNAQATEDDQVRYADLVGLMTSSITEIIDIITAVLVAFVSISLVVSSIMIAIITYISVLERTKEIGIMRALGASKGDITKIFNAETFIEGLLSGVIGVAVPMALNVPISAYIEQNYGAANIAHLPWYDAFLLIGISVVLTFIAGFIPARLAAKKDPVVALRSE